MNSNSFLIKGWCITIVSAIFVLSQKETNIYFLAFSIVPCLSFWIVDGFFISTERKYRELYTHVIKLDEASIDFSMDTNPFKKNNNSWICGILSKTLIPFYGIIILSISAFFVYLLLKTLKIL